MNTLKLLSVLGETPSEIADTLLVSGFYGRINDLCACPLAKYLRANGVVFHSIDSDGVYGVVETDGEDEYDDDVIGVPRAVMDFILDFDYGKYPALVEEPPVCAY